jgi:hypothetical protein
VIAERRGSRYTTTVALEDVDVRLVRAGATLPAGEVVDEVRLDGTLVRRPTVRETYRGVEVTVPVPTTGRHVVTVSAG